MEYVTRLLKNNSTLVPVQFSQILLSSDMLLLDRVNAEVFGRMLAEYKKHPFPLTSDADVYYSTLTGVWHSWLDLPKITEELSDDEGPAPGEEYEPSADVSIVLVDELELRKRKEAKEERRRAREEAKLLEQRLAALADCRLEAMSFFLASENIDFQIIQDNLQFSAEHRADDGYLSADRSRYGQGVYDQATLCGFTIALDSFDLELQTQTASAHRLGLFCQDDVNVAISNGAAAILFSLDQISADYPYHPFQKQRLAPASLAGTEIHQTLLHTDYLLKFLSTGVEPCGHAPFQLRAVEAGVLNRLPANLRRKLLTIHQVQGPAGGEQHRLWIEPVSELKYNLEQRDGKVYVQFGELKMGVRAKRLVPTTDGDLADAPADDEEESSSHAFAKLVTTYYAEFGQAFPEFLRLRELCKISAMVNIYQSIIFNAKPDHAGCRGFAQKIANDWKRIQAETGYPFSKVPSRSEVQSKIKVAQPQLYEARQKAQEVANALGSVLSNVQAEVDNSFESNVENAYRDVCRRANVRNLSWQEEREAKDLLRSRIRESADTQLANFRQQLINQQEDLPVYLRQQWLREGGSSSWVEGVAAYIHNRTTQQYDRLVDDSIGFIRVEMEKQNEALENVMIQRYSAVLTKSTVLALLKSTSTDWVTLAANETYNREYREWQRKQSRQEARHGLKLGMDLTFDHLPPRYWVPATYAISRSGAFLRRIYGGVNLQTQLLAAKQVAQPPPNSSFVMGTATVTCQLAHGSPYSPAVIQQNIQANNVAAANRVRVQVQVPSYTRGNGTVVPGYTRTQWVNPNGPSSNHGYEYKKARNDYLRNVVVNDPNVPTHVRAWVTQEIRNRGSGYLRSPPGFQVGHKVGAAVGGAHESSNFRMENQKDNEDRGRKFRR